MRTRHELYMPCASWALIRHCMCTQLISLPVFQIVPGQTYTVSVTALNALGPVGSCTFVISRVHAEVRESCVQRCA